MRVHVDCAPCIHHIIDIRVYYCPFVLTFLAEVECNCTVHMTVQSVVGVYFA